MSDELRAELEGEARQWAGQHEGEEAPKTAPATEEKSSEEQPKAEPSAQALGGEDIASFAVTAIDFGLQNFVSERCAFKPQQRDELVKLGTKVADKYLPALQGFVEPEYAFVGAVAFFAFTNFMTAEPVAKPNATPGGGSSEPAAGSGVATDATIDGQKVEARVH